MVISASFALAVSEVNIFGFARGGERPLGLTLGLDLEGGTHLVYKAMPEDGREPTKDDMEGLRNIIDKRVNEFGVSEAVGVDVRVSTAGVVSGNVVAEFATQNTVTSTGSEVEVWLSNVNVTRAQEASPRSWWQSGSSSNEMTGRRPRTHQ